jgi:hypothetical protein
MLSAPLAGRLFSTKHREVRQAGEATVENFDEVLRDTLRADDEVVLFLPRPVTKADLLREKFVCAATIRRRRRRRKLTKWCTGNAGTVVFVIGLFVLAWFVAAG